MKLILSLCAVAICASTANAQTPSLTLSNALVTSVVNPLTSLSGLAIQGSTLALVGTGMVVQAVLETSTQVITYSVKSAVNGSLYVLKLSVSAARAAAVTVGTVISVVAQAGGEALMASGQLLAFVPTQVTQTLFFQEQIK